MELTFLVDNNSMVGKPFIAEPALSMHIQDGDTRILFDAGYSDIFLTNARRMGLSLLDLDYVVLSHGHYDHTWGLDALLRHYFEASELKMDVPYPKLVAHPEAFDTKFDRDAPEIGTLLSSAKAARHFELALSAEPVWITDRLVTLGEIERGFDFEGHAQLGHRLTDKGKQKDFLPDDTAMAYVSDDGLVVITGCAHAGVCNTVEQARRITGMDKVRSVVGGFHLRAAKPERLNPTTDYLGALNLESLYACHCTDLAAKISMARKCPVMEVGSGLKLQF